MNAEVILVSTISVLAVVAYAKYRFSGQRQPVQTSIADESTNKSGSQKSPATHPEQASHNLEHSDQMQLDENRTPIRDVLDADFAAEAHGFTGFEIVGKGSRYKSSNNA